MLDTGDALRGAKEVLQLRFIPIAPTCWRHCWSRARSYGLSGERSLAASVGLSIASPALAPAPAPFTAPASASPLSMSLRTSIWAFTRACLSRILANEFLRIRLARLSAGGLSTEPRLRPAVALLTWPTGAHLRPARSEPLTCGTSRLRECDSHELAAGCGLAGVGDASTWTGDDAAWGPMQWVEVAAAKSVPGVHGCALHVVRLGIDELVCTPVPLTCGRPSAASLAGGGDGSRCVVLGWLLV